MAKKNLINNPRDYMLKAIEVMNKSIQEPREDKVSPKVGAVLIKPDNREETAYRGELRHGDQAENQKQRLADLAINIKETVLNESLNNKLYAIGEETDDNLTMVKEGMVIYRLHKYYERNTKINNQKKAIHLKKYGQLDCEACDFNFHKTYGDLGKGYIECHHTTPLLQIVGESITTLEDLGLVCSNCHRMIHRDIDTVSVRGLRGIVLEGKY